MNEAFGTTRRVFFLSTPVVDAELEAAFADRSWSFSACILAWPAEICRALSALLFAASELRGRFASGSGLPVRGSELADALGEEYMVGEGPDVLAVRLSSSLWNLRFVVASAGGSAGVAGVAGVVMLGWEYGG